MWNSKKVQLHFGLEKPVRILHLTDAHIVLANEDECEENRAFAAWRQPVFDVSGETPSRLLEAALEYGNAFDCTVLTGDAVDNYSVANYDEMRRIFAGKDFMFALGNHEYLQPVRHARRAHERIEGKRELWDELQSIFPEDLEISSRIVGGVNLITADNAQMCWSKRQFERFKEEVAKGYPILLFTHCPVEYATPKYQDHMYRYGFTDEEVQFAYQVNDYLINEPLIKGFFAGHCHLYQDQPYGGKPCYLTGALFQRELTEIEID